MKNKLLLMQIGLALQIGAIALMLISLIFDAETVAAYAFFSLAGIQVLDNLILGFKYNDKRRKAYLKLLFWVQGVGTLIAMIFAWSDVEVLGGIAFGFIYFGWIFIPFFMVFWSLYNSWKGIKDAQLELQQNTTAQKLD